MITYVDITPDMIKWAYERAGVTFEQMLKRFAKLDKWINGEAKPTVRQLEAFAKAVHVPIGYMFLPEPPQENLPITDFRTTTGEGPRRPSPDLLDVIYSCQERQSWYRDYVKLNYDIQKCPFVASVSLDTPPEDAANKIRTKIGFSLDARSSYGSLDDILRFFIQQVEAVGILTMVSGIVHSNTRRILNTEEFRGFALSDQLAPLIFINGKDAKAGQMFTLAHELAHIWLGTTGLYNTTKADDTGHKREEIWCNAVAAEILVPMKSFKKILQDPQDPLNLDIKHLAKHFKVSTLVILRRLLDAKFIDSMEFDKRCTQEYKEFHAIKEKNKSGGGDFYKTTPARNSRTLTRALITSAVEGNTLYRDAYRMLGVKKNKTFNNIGREVGVLL